MGHLDRSLSSQKVNLTQQDSQALACPHGRKANIPFLGPKHKEQLLFPSTTFGVSFEMSRVAPLAHSLFTISWYPL